MEYLGKLHQAAVEFPQTDIWMDSCGEEELEYGLKRGIVGATSNPIIVGNVIKNELNIWEKPTTSATRRSISRSSCAPTSTTPKPSITSR